MAHIIPLLIAFLMTSACGASPKTQTEKMGELEVAFKPGTDRLAAPLTLNGVTFPEGARFFFNHPDQIYGSYLTEDTQVGGLSCAKDSLIRFYRDGKLNLATLAQDAQINGVKVPKGAEVIFTKSGELEKFTLLYAKEEQNIQGIVFPKNTSLYFFGNGKLEMAQLENEAKVGDFFAAPRTQVTFHANGQLQSLELERPAAVKGTGVSKGFKLRFKEDGSWDATVLKTATVIRGDTFPAGTIVLGLENSGSHNGEPERLQLGGDMLLKGVTYPSGSVVEFTTDFEFSRKSIRRIMLSRDTEVAGIPAAGGTRVDLHYMSNGAPAQVTLSKALTLKGMDLPEGARVHLNDEGALIGLEDKNGYKKF